MSHRAGCSTCWDGRGCRLLGGMYFVGIEMSGLEPIDGDSVLTTIDIDSEIFIRVFFMTRYGPSYGSCSGLRTASCRMKTCVAVDSPSTTVCCCFAEYGGVEMVE